MRPPRLVLDVAIGSGRDLVGLAAREAGRAHPEQLEAMLVDPEAGLAGDVTDTRRRPVSSISVGPAAARADHVMVVDRLAADVGVLAGGQIDALDDAELLEDLERPEDRRPTDPEVARPRLGHDARSREVPVLVGDKAGERPPRLGQPVAGLVERGHECGRVAHGRMLAQNETQSHYLDGQRAVDTEGTVGPGPSDRVRPDRAQPTLGGR